MNVFMNPSVRALKTAGAASCLTIACALVACTAIVDPSATQCRSQQDCLSRGPEFAETTCTVDRVCVKIVTDARACRTNQECIDKNGGAPYTCRKSDGKCAPLLSTFCPRIMADKEDLVDDNTVYIGHTSPANPDGQQAEAAAELARSEIKRAGNMPPATPGGPRRPLAIIACNAELIAPGVSETMFKHLSETVQVPYAISGFVTPDAIPAANHFSQRDILMTTQNQATALTTFADKDLVFRLGFSDDVTLSAQAPFLRDYLEAKMRADFGLSPTDPVKVIILTHTTDYNDQLEALRQSLRVNNLSFTENQQAGNLQVVTYGGFEDPISFPNPDAERAKAVSAAVKFKPHLVLITTSPPIVALTWTDLQRQWQGADNTRPYVIGGFPTMAPFMPPAMAQFPNETARKRFFAMRTLPFDFNPADFETWISRLFVKSPELVGQPIGTTAPIIYDGVYMFAYSLAAIGNSPVKGPELSRGLRKVADASGGIEIKWGPEDYSKAEAALSAGNSIAYKGPIGSYGWDAKGDHPGNPDVFCFGPPPTRTPKSSGYSYDIRTQKSVGTVTNCD